MRHGYLYILASRPGGAIYIGVKSNLPARVYQHKAGEVKGHTQRDGINQLVYYEVYDSIRDAIQREKNLKHWPRAWKTKLITEANATWRDLYEEICS